jgi:hypothetical protein
MYEHTCFKIKNPDCWRDSRVMLGLVLERMDFRDEA